jgi:pyruvate carboxylase
MVIFMEPKEFKKVLIANRGEIAVRIFRACYDLGLNTVAIYSKEDTYSLFRIKADESYLIGENKSPLGAYLDVGLIIDLAKRRGVDAIHPGYGFLSENPELARACEETGIEFIGPSSRILEQMGNKLAAKEIALRCGVPTVPGSAVPLRDEKDALEKAEFCGYPVILKAAAGGGGRGMRRCDSPKRFRPPLDLYSRRQKRPLAATIFLLKSILWNLNI